jgi:hypothetical protein
MPRRCIVNAIAVVTIVVVVVVDSSKIRANVVKYAGIGMLQPTHI